MKNILLTIKILFVLWYILPLVSVAQETVKDTKTYNWKKAKNNSWPGVVNEQMYWYRIDANAKLWWSGDGKKWEEDADGMWADKEGVFYKIDGSQLAESTDGGSTWNETLQWKWMAVDGRWYKLDKDKIVWVSK